MEEVNVIKDFSDIQKLPNRDKVIEVVERQKNGRIKAILKYMVQDNDGSEELKKKALELLNKTDRIFAQVEKNGAQLSKIANLNTLNVILNGMNLCATAAGFVIMNEKLNKISDKIDDIIENQNKQADKESNYKFKNVVLEYKKLLDHKKTKKNISEDEYVDLLNEECAVFEYLYKGFMDDTANDIVTLLYAMTTLASMITCNMASLDEVYYFNNRNSITEGSIWHEGHSDWESIYSMLLSDEFASKLQDYCFLYKNMDQYTTDLFLEAMNDHTRKMKQAVEDRKMIILLHDNIEDYNNTYNSINEEAEKEVQIALNRA